MLANWKNLNRSTWSLLIGIAVHSIIRDHDFINVINRRCFSSLHNTESKARVHNFFMNQPLSNLNEQEMERLEVPISVVDISSTIKYWQNGKSPEGDGFYICYSVFPKKPPHFDYIMMLYGSNLCVDSNHIVAHTCERPFGCKQYRYLSLLNNDKKNFAKNISNT